MHTTAERTSQVFYLNFECVLTESLISFLQPKHWPWKVSPWGSLTWKCGSVLVVCTTCTTAMSPGIGYLSRSQPGTAVTELSFCLLSRVRLAELALFSGAAAFEPSAGAPCCSVSPSPEPPFVASCFKMFSLKPQVFVWLSIGYTPDETLASI